MSKEKYTLHIMIEPTNSPCERCYIDCSTKKKLNKPCDKLESFNKKIIAKEYDYEKALNKLTKKIGECLEQGGDEYCCACCALQTLIGKQI